MSFKSRVIVHRIELIMFFQVSRSFVFGKRCKQPLKLNHKRNDIKDFDNATKTRIYAMRQISPRLKLVNLFDLKRIKTAINYEELLRTKN